jgi:hypothetical protein
MALRIGEEFRQIGGEAPHADWEVHPTTPWNYALATETEPSAYVVEEAAIGPVPFAGESAPVSLLAPARRLPGWTLENDSAAPPPRTRSSAEKIEMVTLIPYGSTRLRISEFPTARKREG